MIFSVPNASSIVGIKVKMVVVYFILQQTLLHWCGKPIMPPVILFSHANTHTQTLGSSIRVNLKSHEHIVCLPAKMSHSKIFSHTDQSSS